MSSQVYSMSYFINDLHLSFPIFNRLFVTFSWIIGAQCMINLWWVSCADTHMNITKILFSSNCQQFCLMYRALCQLGNSGSSYKFPEWNQVFQIRYSGEYGWYCWQVREDNFNISQSWFIFTWTTFGPPNSGLGSINLLN